MKKLLRINLTNYCPMECCSCPIYCEKGNHSYLPFHAFQKIIDQYKDYQLKVVLEGGEPLAHKGIFLFLEYLSACKHVQNVTIRTNGIFLKEELADSLFALIKRSCLRFDIKVKITSELIEKNKEHMAMCKSLFDHAKRLGTFQVSFEVFYSNDADYEYLLSMIDKYELPKEFCEFSVFRAIGKLSCSEYPKVEDGGLKCWECFASDGTNFEQSLTARAEYEKSLGLSGQVLIPVFDAVSHKALWKELFEFISSISYENRNDVCITSHEIQRRFIETHLNKYTYGMLHEKIYNYAVYYATRFHRSEWSEKSPFVPSVPFDWCAEKKVAEFFLNEQAMMRTTDIQRFYENKNLCLEIADSIANLSVRDDIKVTLDKCCCSC